MKRNTFFTLFLCLVFAVLMLGCSVQNSNGQAGATTKKPVGGAQMANPIKTYDSLAKAEKAAGFQFTVPEGVNVGGADYAQYYWSTINNDLIEVRYGGEGDEVCYMRKAGVGKGDKAGEVTDISGDYNVYDKVKEVDITLEDRREATVTLKGQKNKFYLALWQLKGAKDNGLWNYAIGIRGVPEQDLLELVKMVE